MAPFFVSHLNGQNQIPPSDAVPALTFISAILLLLSFLTIRRSEERAGQDEFLTIETSSMLRGLAVLFLLLGHFTLKCVQGDSFLKSAGMWAVVIFLFVSGIALTKRYGLTNLGKAFFLKRLRTVLPPTWITLILFYILDFVLRHQTYRPVKIIFNFLGIMKGDPPNGPDWFITYILYLYLLYILVSKIKLPSMGRILFLTLLSCATTILILTSTALRGALGGWVFYTSVFPLSVAVGTYRKEVRETLNHFLRKSQIIYLLMVFLCLYLYFSTIRIYKTPDLIFSWRYAALLILAVQPVTFILAVLMLSHLADIFKVNSKFLMWLGEHSLEIFLVHLPFMVFYDFFLFRKPLSLFFPLYLLFIFALGYSLKKLTSFLDTLFMEAPARNRSTQNI